MRSRKSEYRYNLHIALFFFYSHYSPSRQRMHKNYCASCRKKANEGTTVKETERRLGNVMHKKINKPTSIVTCTQPILRRLLPWSVLEAISHRPSFHTRFLKPLPERERRVWCMHACTLALRLIVAVITMQRNAFIHGFIAAAPAPCIIFQH
jgi:hypothetical protein